MKRLPHRGVVAVLGIGHDRRHVHTRHTRSASHGASVMNCWSASYDAGSVTRANIADIDLRGLSLNSPSTYERNDTGLELRCFNDTTIVDQAEAETTREPSADEHQAAADV